MYKVKRPIGLTGFTFFISGSIALSMPKEYTAILLALFALFIFIHCRTRKVYTKYLLCIFAAAVAAFAYINIYSSIWTAKIESITTDTAVYKGYISYVNNSDNTSYTLTVVDEKGGEEFKADFYYHNGFTIGDTVSITGKFSPAKNNRYTFSLYADNIIGNISVKEAVNEDFSVVTLRYKAVLLRRILLQTAAQLYSKDVLGIVSAISYGDKHLVTQEIKEGFEAAGLSHVLVVSGLHVWIIVGAIQFVLGFIPLNKKIKNIAAALFILVFMYTVGLSQSVIRAGALAAVILIGRNFLKDQDSLTSLGLIGMVCILSNPYITRDIGAMLSYAASVGLIFADVWCKRKNFEGMVKKFVCAFSAVLFTMPVLALAGMRVTIMSPVFNILLGSFIAIICVLSVFTTIAGVIPVVCHIGALMAGLNSVLVKSLISILDFIKTGFSFALINLSHPAFLAVIAATVTAMFIAYFQFENIRIRKIFVITVSIAALLCYNLLDCNTVTVTAFDSGRECSFHISHREKEYLVLTEETTPYKIRQQLLSVNSDKYDVIYYCPKEIKDYTDYSQMAESVVMVEESGVYDNGLFTITSDISKKKKQFGISVSGCDICFGHGKTESADSEYYFLGNDKPKSVKADNIYIFGNIPSWMDVENITTVNSDLTIKINLKTGNYKTVEDVFNFGW